jgi:hypothetical protein
MAENITQQVESALEAGRGLLRLAPAWVPRSFAEPGRRLPLVEEDLYALGAERGGIDERWLASTTNPDNGAGMPHDEGLSYVVGPDGGKFLLRDAVAAAGAPLIGKAMMDKHGRWPVLGKFFDNAGPLPFHIHARAKHAALVGEVPKPEAYYWPKQLNVRGNRFPLTYFGLDPMTTKADVIRCLERWDQGDNSILDLSKAYRLPPGSGWMTPSGLLHAPSSLVHYEIQWGTDTFAMFESMVEGKRVPWDMLVKNVPGDKKQDLDFIINLLDWEANVDPCIKEKHYLKPKTAAGGPEESYEDKWVIYGGADDGEDYFSARELTVRAGGKATITDPGASGIVAIQGRGLVNGNPIETAHAVRFGELTWDEYFVSDQAAKGGYTVENNGVEPLVILRHFGPDCQR